MSQLTISADQSEASYVAIVTEWLGADLPSTDHRLTSDVYERLTDDNKEESVDDNALDDAKDVPSDNESKDITTVFKYGDVRSFGRGRKKYFKRRYLLMQLEDLNNNKVMTPSLKFDQQTTTTSGLNEWNVRLGGDDDDGGKVDGDDDDESKLEGDQFGDEIVDEGFVLIDEIHGFDETTTSSSSTTKATSTTTTTTTAATTTPITTTSKDVSGNFEFNSDDDDSKNGELNFVITTPEHFKDFQFKNETESKISFSTDDASCGISKGIHYGDEEGNIKTSEISLSANSLNYNEEMKLLLHANDPSVDHFRFSSLFSEIEYETPKSSNILKLTESPFNYHNIYKKPVISVSKLDLYFPSKTTTTNTMESDHSDSKLSTGKPSNQVSISKTLPDIFAGTSSSTTTTTTTTSTSTTFTGQIKSDSSSSGNIDSKLSGFESMVSDELTNIMELGQREKDIELEMPDFTFDSIKSEYEEINNKNKEVKKVEKESETKQVESIKNILLPDFNFDDLNRDQKQIQTSGETKLKVETTEFPSTIKTTTVNKKESQTDKEKSKLEQELQDKIFGNITLPSFDFQNLSSHKRQPETTSITSTSSSSVSTSVTSNTKPELTFKNLVQEELDNVVDTAMKQISGSMYGDIQLENEEKDFKNVALPDFEFDDLKLTSKSESEDVSKEIKLNVDKSSSDKATDIKKEYKTEDNYDDITFSSYGFQDSPKSPEMTTSFTSMTSSEGSKVKLEFKPFENLTHEEVNKMIETREVEAMKQLEIQGFDIEASKPKSSKEKEEKITSETSHSGTFKNILLPDFEFDEELDLKSKPEVDVIKKLNETEDDSITKDRKENETQNKLFENIFPTFDFQGLTSQKLPENTSVASTSTFSTSTTWKSKPKDDIAVKTQSDRKDNSKETHIELPDFDFDSSDVPNISLVDSENLSKTKEASKSILSTSPTQITTSAITISKVSQTAEKTHPKTSIRLLSRSENNEKDKVTKETTEKHLEFPHFNIDLPISDTHESTSKDAKPKEIKHVELENIIGSKHIEFPSFDIDSNQPGQNLDDVMESGLIVKEKPVEENESLSRSSLIEKSEFEIDDDRKDELKEIRKTESGNFDDLGTTNLNMEIHSFDDDANTGGFDTVNETESEEKIGTEILSENVLDDRVIDFYVENILESAANTIGHMKWMEETKKLSGDDDDDDDDEYDEDIHDEVRYRMLTDDDDDNMKLFKRKVKTDSLGNILQKEEGKPDDDNDDDDDDDESKAVRIEKKLEDIPYEDIDTHPTRLKQISRDLKIQTARSPIGSSSSVEIVVTPATPVDQKIATFDWYGRLGETSLIEEEKLEEKKARVEAESRSTSSEDYEADYDDEEDDDKDDAAAAADDYDDEVEDAVAKDVLTYDDEDMKLSDDENDEDDKGDDDDDDDRSKTNTDDDESGTFASYKREVIRVSYDYGDDHEHRSRSPSLDGEDRIHPALYSPKKRFSMENIETIKEENETFKSEISNEDQWLPGSSDSEFAKTLFRISSNFGKDKPSEESSSRFFIGDTQLNEAVGSMDIPGFEPATYITAASEIPTHEVESGEISEASSSEQNVKLISYVKHGDADDDLDILIPSVGEVTALPDLKINIPAAVTVSSSSSSPPAYAKQISPNNTNNNLLSLVDINVIPASPVPPEVMENENWFGNLPEEEIETESKYQQHDEVNFFDTNESETMIGEIHPFEMDIDKDNKNESAIQMEKPFVNVRHDSSKPTFDSSQETKDFVSFQNDSPSAKFDPETSEIIPTEVKSFPKVLHPSTFQNIDTTTYIIKSEFEKLSGESKHGQSNLSSVSFQTSSSSSSSPLEIKPLDTTTLTTTSSKVEISAPQTDTTSTINIDASEIETKTKPFFTKFQEAGDRLLNVVDINVIPASPVPMEVIKDENYFGNTEQNESETEYDDDDDANLFESEEKEIESFTKTEIPFFDLENELSNDSLPSGVKGQKKMVTSFSVDDASLSSATVASSSSPSSSSSSGMISKALDMATEFFNVTLPSTSSTTSTTSSTTTTRTTTTTYSSEFEAPDVNWTASQSISSQLESSDPNILTHKDNHKDMFTSIDLSSLPSLSTEVQSSKSSSASATAANTTSTFDVIVSEIEAKTKPFFTKVKEAGDKLLNIVDINVIPASPVPPEVMKHENWFGNAEQQNESETKRQDVDDRGIGNDESEKLTEVEIPFFDLGEKEVSKKDSISEIESGSREKTVTSFAVDPVAYSSSIIDKAIEITSNLFNKSTEAPPTTSSSATTTSATTSATQSLIKSERQFIDKQLWHQVATTTHYGESEDASGDYELSDSMHLISMSGGLKRKRASDGFGDAISGDDDDDDDDDDDVAEKDDDDEEEEEEDDDEESESKINKTRDYANEENWDPEKDSRTYKFSDNFVDIKEVITDEGIDILSGVGTSGVLMTSFPGEITHSPRKSKVNENTDDDIYSFEVGDATTTEFQDFTSFDLETKSKLNTSKSLDLETYDNDIKKLDDQIETSKRELDLIRSSTPSFEIETYKVGKNQHQTDIETAENLLGDVTFESSMAEFRDVSSIMSPGSDVTGDEPMTDKVVLRPFPVENLLDSSALESPGKEKTGRRSLADDWLDASLEIYGSKQEHDLQSQEGRPMREENAGLTHITGPITRTITKTADPWLDKSQSYSPIHASTPVTHTKIYTHDDDDDDDDDDDVLFGDDDDDADEINSSSQIGWRQQSDESQLKHHKTTKLSSTIIASSSRMSEPQSSDTIHNPTQISESKRPITEGQDSSELVSTGLDSLGQTGSGEIDGLKEEYELKDGDKFGEEISKMMEKKAAEKDDLHKDEPHKDELHKDDLHKDDLHKDEFHKDDLHKDDLHKDDLHKDDLHKDDLHKDEPQKDEFHKDDLHKDEHKIDLHKDDLHKDEFHKDKLHKDDLHKDELHKDEVPSFVSRNEDEKGTIKSETAHSEFMKLHEKNLKDIQEQSFDSTTFDEDEMFGFQPDKNKNVETSFRGLENEGKTFDSASNTLHDHQTDDLENKTGDTSHGYKASGIISEGKSGVSLKDLLEAEDMETFSPLSKVSHQTEDKESQPGDSSEISHVSPVHDEITKKESESQKDEDVLKSKAETSAISLENIHLTEDVMEHEQKVEFPGQDVSKHAEVKIMEKPHDHDETQVSMEHGEKTLHQKVEADKLKDDETAEHPHGDEIEEHPHGDKIEEHPHGDKFAEHLHDDEIAEHHHDDRTADHSHDGEIAEHPHDDEIAEHLHDDKTAEHLHDDEIAEHHHDDRTADHPHDDKTAEHHHGDKTAEHPHDGEIAEHYHDGEIADHPHDDEIAEHHHDDKTAEHPHDDKTAEHHHGDEIKEHGQTHLGRVSDETEILKKSNDIEFTAISDDPFRRLEHDVPTEHAEAIKPQDADMDNIQHGDSLLDYDEMREIHAENKTEASEINNENVDISTMEDDSDTFNRFKELDKTHENKNDSDMDQILDFSATTSPEHVVDNNNLSKDEQGSNLNVLESGVVTAASVMAAEKLSEKGPQDRVGHDDSFEMKRSKVGRSEVEEVIGDDDDDDDDGMATSAFDELRALDPHFDSKSAFNKTLTDRSPIHETAIIEHKPEEGTKGLHSPMPEAPSGVDRNDVLAVAPLPIRVGGEFMGEQTETSDKKMDLRKSKVGAADEEIEIADEIDEIHSEISPIAICPARGESEDGHSFKEVVIADSKHLVDMLAIEPYMKCVSHGGYYGDGLNAIIVLAACYLPPKSLPHYAYVMDHLFYYIMNVLEIMAVDQYKLVYLHGTMTEAKLPSNKWMKKCYETIDKKLKKRMDQMIVVHPTFWLKTLIFLFASSKFSKKLVYVKSLETMNKMIPSQDLHIPEEVVEVDHKLNPPRKRSK